MSDLQEFERSIKQQLEQFLNPKADKPKAEEKSQPTQGLEVHLAVRKKGEVSDTLFIHASSTLSKLQARIEAEKEARHQGWPVIAYLVRYK